MLFMTYKPKTAKNVKAELVTDKNLDEIAATFFGMARIVRAGEGTPVSKLQIGTLEGIVEVEVGEWVVRTDEGITNMSDDDFNKQYERARSGRDS